MSTSNIDPEVGYKIHEAIASALHDEADGGILNRWVLMTEHSLLEGGSSLAYITSAGLGTWEVLGMAETVKILAKENLLSMYDEEDDEDE